MVKKQINKEKEKMNDNERKGQIRKRRKENEKS